MTKFVTLMNPGTRRRRRSMSRNRMGRFVRHNPSPRRRARRYHRNPTGHKPSAAVRRKISLAVRRANARRHGGGVIRRSMALVMPRRRSVARRSSHRVARRSFRRYSSSLSRTGSFTGEIRSIFSGPMLMKAGGAVAATIGTGYVLSAWGAQLPFANNTYGRMVYTLGIPALGAFLLRKKAPAIAEGMIIGGLVMTLNTLMQSFTAPAAAAAAPATVGSYGVAGQLRPGFGYYPKSVSNLSASMGGVNRAFQRAW